MTSKLDLTGSTFTGPVKLLGAEIAGQLVCTGATLQGKGERGRTLAAANIKVGSDVLLNEGFVADGPVQLLAADIAGTLNCQGARLQDEGEEAALAADRMRVGGDVYLDDSHGRAFTVSGEVSLRSARVAGKIFLGEKSTSTNNERGRVYPFSLDGCTYADVDGAGLKSWKQGLAWIRSTERKRSWILPMFRRHDGSVYASQPYEQLAGVYRQAGRDADARKVAIARRADLRKYGNLRGYRWFTNWLLDKTIKYGYQTWRALVMLLVVFVAFFLVSLSAQQHHDLIMPVGSFSGAAPSATHCSADKDAYPCFYPFGYTIDTVIPVINVHQAAYWGLNGNASWGWAWVAGAWTATGLGWALATLLVAGYTGLVRHD